MTPSRRRLRPEAFLLIQLYAVYSLSRSLADGGRITADANARAVRQVEVLLGLDIEAGLNVALLRAPWLEIAAAYWYSSTHFLVTLVVLALLWFRRPHRYPQARNVLVVATGLALLCYLAFPTTPPRLMPGYVDTLSATANVGWWGSGGSTPKGLLINELAAMPSLHVGWAFWSAMSIWQVLRGRLLGLLAWLYPVVTALVVVATANHWVLDALAGIALVLAARAFVGLTWRRPAFTPGPDPSAQGEG